MTNLVTRRETCRLCDSRDLETVLHFEPTPVGDDFVSTADLERPQPTFPLDIRLCRACGNAQLLNVVNPDVIYREYRYTSSVSLGLVEHFQRYATDVLRRTGASANSLVVEIGSNEGAMLRTFKEQGMRVLGVDPARAIAARATAAGLETLPEYFTVALAKKIHSERGAAQVIIANNVFANIDNLADLADAIRDLLAPDGVFVFETSYFLDVVERMLLDTVFHEHLSYFAVKPLATFFRRHGLELIDVQRTAPKGGSLRGTVQRAGAARAIAPAIAEQIAQEENAGLFEPATYRALSARVDTRRAELCRHIDDWRAQDKTVAGYGAAVGLTTLVYHFDLGNRLSFIVDDNPDKQNTYSPGHHLPVLTSNMLYERKPDYVIVLAWRYIEPIIKRHQAFAAQGGKFVLPLPDVKVIP